MITSQLTFTSSDVSKDIMGIPFSAGDFGAGVQKEVNKGHTRELWRIIFICKHFHLKLFEQSFCFGVLFLINSGKAKSAVEFLFFVWQFLVRKIVNSLIKSVFTQMETEITTRKIHVLSFEVKYYNELNFRQISNNIWVER